MVNIKPADDVGLQQPSVHLSRRHRAHHRELVEEHRLRGIICNPRARHDVPSRQLIYPLCQVVRVVVRRFGRLTDPCRSHRRAVDRHHQANELRAGADVGCSTLAPDVLLPGLKRQRVSCHAVGVDRLPYDPPWQLAQVRGLRGQQPYISTSERERHAQRLSFSSGNVDSERSRRFQHAASYWIRVHHCQRTRLAGRFRERGVIFEGTEKVGGLPRYTSDITARQRIRQRRPWHNIHGYVLVTGIRLDDLD